MKIRVKERGSLGEKRIESESKIESVVINENLLNPEKESIDIFFRGKYTSGILSLANDELVSLVGSVKPNLGLIRNAGKSKRK